MVKGFGRGSKSLGIPTANLPPEAWDQVCIAFLSFFSFGNSSSSVHSVLLPQTLPLGQPLDFARAFSRYFLCFSLPFFFSLACAQAHVYFMDFMGVFLYGAFAHTHRWKGACPLKPRAFTSGGLRLEMTPRSTPRRFPWAGTRISKAKPTAAQAATTTGTARTRGSPPATAGRAKPWSRGCSTTSGTTSTAKSFASWCAGASIFSCLTRRVCDDTTCFIALGVRILLGGSS